MRLHPLLHSYLKSCADDMQARTRQRGLQLVQLCGLQGVQGLQVAPEAREALVPAAPRLGDARPDQHAHGAQRLGRVPASCALQLLEGRHGLAHFASLRDQSSSQRYKLWSAAMLHMGELVAS